MKTNILLAAAGFTLALMPSLQAAENSNEAYSEGFNLVLQQRWQEARDFFTRYANEFPGSDMQDDAGYWRCFAWERTQNVNPDQYSCYKDFISKWENSNWLDDARERMMIVARRLAEQGQPQFMSEAFAGLDFNSDFSVENLTRFAQDQARMAVEIARNVQEDMREQQDRVRVVQDNVRSLNVQINRNRRDVDRELLALLSAVKDDPRAGELLIKRFNDSEDPEEQARLVLMMEDLQGEAISEFLRDVAEDNPTEEVRNNAVMTLLDRNDSSAVELMRKVIASDAYPLSMRSAIIRTVGRWDKDNALDTLRRTIVDGNDQRLVQSASNGLMSLRNSEAYGALVASYQNLNDPELRYAVLETMDGRGVDELFPFLTEIALGSDDKAAAIAIENIASLENEMAVSTLQHIYFNTSSQQRHLAVIHGMGEAESPQGVAFLIEILPQETAVEMRSSIVRALGESEQATAIEPIMQVYRETQDEDVRTQVVRALRRLDDFPQAGNYLLEILEDRLDAN